jgi:SAM-dependent methyltransferase
MKMNLGLLLNKLNEYYSARASEYEKIYLKPERQADLKALKEFAASSFKGKNVLELACGTGYWTEVLSKTAESVLAVDSSAEVLKIAEAKNYHNNNVLFQQADLYELSLNSSRFDSAFGGFIWSHIPLEKLSDFIDIVHKNITKESVVAFIDNLYVKGNSTPIFNTDGKGNTYQKRRLEDGSEYLVMKNYPSEKEIRYLLKDKSDDLEFINLNYFWGVKYKKK